MEELQFPMTFTQCPNCSSTRRLAMEILQQEKDKGKIRDDVTDAFLSRDQSVIADNTRTWLSAPAIITYYDVCVDCGATYCIRAELVTVTPTLTKPGPPGGLISPN